MRVNGVVDVACDSLDYDVAETCTQNTKKRIRSEQCAFLNCDERALGLCRFCDAQVCDVHDIGRGVFHHDNGTRIVMCCDRPTYV